MYDSVSSCQVPTRVKKQIAAIIFTDNKEINLHFQSVQAQCGHSDCGLFVVAFATFLCQRKPCANQLCPAFAQLLLKFLTEGVISKFPATARMKKITKQ